MVARPNEFGMVTVSRQQLVGLQKVGLGNNVARWRSNGRRVLTFAAPDRAIARANRRGVAFVVCLALRRILQSRAAGELCRSM